MPLCCSQILVYCKKFCTHKQQTAFYHWHSWTFINSISQLWTMIGGNHIQLLYSNCNSIACVQMPNAAFQYPSSGILTFMPSNSFVTLIWQPSRDLEGYEWYSQNRNKEASSEYEYERQKLTFLSVQKLNPTYPPLHLTSVAKNHIHPDQRWGDM